MADGANIGSRLAPPITVPGRGQRLPGGAASGQTRIPAPRRMAAPYRSFRTPGRRGSDCAKPNRPSAQRSAISCVSVRRISSFQSADTIPPATAEYLRKSRRFTSLSARQSSSSDIENWAVSERDQAVKFAMIHCDDCSAQTSQAARPAPCPFGVLDVTPRHRRQVSGRICPQLNL
jgi:hypothetical protein